jgi:hypothetical protein
MVLKGGDWRTRKRGDRGSGNCFWSYFFGREE